MSRLSIAAIAVLLPAASDADAGEATEHPPPPDIAMRDGTLRAPADMKDQGIGAAIGIAGGGRVTPGGLRIIGHYLYQMTDTDWFDGTAAFTFGSGDPACFRDRMDDYICDHSLIDGFSAEIAANVRRFFGSERRGADGAYWPYLRLGVGVAVVRFSDDDVTGLGIPVHAGGGLRVSLDDGIALIAEATLDIGLGLFTQGLGVEPQIGGSVTAGVEFGM
jgi:hypothetical protein